MNQTSDGSKAEAAEQCIALEHQDIFLMYSDNYLLDLELEADSPLRISIVHENGEVAYVLEGDFASLKRERVALEQGVYRIVLDDFEGDALNISVRLR